MSTANKLTYLNDTKGLLKQKINNLGGDITDNTTFRQYADKLQTIYDNAPKTSYAEGSNITLSNCLKGKLDYEDDKVGYGDTEQYSTQGYNLLPCRGSGVRFEYVNNYYQNTAIEGYFLQDGITFSANTTYYFKLKLLSKPTSATTLNGYFNGTVDNSFSFTNINSLNLNEVYTKTHTPTSEETLTIRAWGNSNNDTYKFQLWITTDNSKDTFEPYTNGASPNPSYPQEIEVVRGKNLSIINSISTTGGGYINYSVSQLANVTKGETYTLSVKNNTSYTSNLNVRITAGGTYSTETQGNLVANGTKSYTFTASRSGILNLNSKLGTEDITNALTEIQLEKGSQATSYLPYNTVEVVVRGINLYNKDAETEAYYYNASGVKTAETSTGVVYTNQEYYLSNTKITISFTNVAGQPSVRVCEYNGDTFIKRTVTQTATMITLDSNTTRVIFSINNSSAIHFNNLQIETGSTATTYEPYITPITKQLSLGDIELAKIGNYRDYPWKNLTNGKWYVHKAIYKIANKTNWTVDSIGGNNRAVISLSGNSLPYSSDIGYASANAISNYLIGISQVNQATTTNINNVAINNANMYIKFDDSTNTTSLVKTKLESLSGLEIYYVPQTPTDTEITDTTLINQLEDIYNMQSVNGTTIVEINGNLPMIMKVRALKNG